MEQAYAPYSRFRVGAAVLGGQGGIHTGCNVENASFGLTICAERAAVCRMIGEGDREIRRILVLADSDETRYPCGACRQFIAEFSSEQTEWIVCNRQGLKQRTTVAALIPHAFTLKEPPRDG